MDIGFRKFKKSAQRSAVIRSLLVGISLGIIVFAVQWLLSKIGNTPADFAFYGISGGLTALVVIGLMLIVLLPRDKRLAKRMDNKMQLHEKVQTMVFFREEDSDMIQLQRETTETILANASGKTMRSKLSWLVCILPVVLAVACMTGAVLVKAQEPAPEPDPDDSSWHLRTYDEQKLKDLIKYVQLSEMEETPKAAVVDRLEQLLAQLKNVKKIGLMKDTVLGCINDIHKTVSEHNTYGLVTRPLITSDNNEAKALGTAVHTLSDTKIDGYFDSLKKTVVAENGLQTVRDLAATIELAMEGSQEDPENPLYQAMLNFAVGLKALPDDADQVAREAAVDSGRAAILAAIEKPKTNAGVEEYTVNRLLAIFGLPKDLLPEDMSDQFENTGDPEDSQGPDDEQKGTHGGMGDGRFEVGSDDQIYDPKQELTVLYGSVLRDYYAVVDSLINEDGMNEELAEFLSDYFGLLFNSDYNPDKS